jgi:hypothetical protein
MDASRVSITYRPLRVGWLVHSEDRESLRLAMRMSFCLAGGNYNPIILVDQPEAEAIVRLFRVDMLERVGVHPDLAAFAAGFPHLPRPITGPLFDLQQRHSFSSCQLLDVLNLERIWEDRPDWDDWADMEKSGLRQPYWNDADPLADVHLAEYGGFPAKAVTKHDYADILTRRVPHATVVGIEIDPAKPLPKELVSAHTLAFLSEHSVSANERSRGWFFPGIYLGDGSLATDLVNFWNIRAANMPIRFVDHTQVDRFSILAPALAARLRANLKGLPAHRRQPGVWATDEALATSLGDLVMPGGGITLCRVGPSLWSGGAIQVPTMVLGEASALGVEVQSRVTFSLAERPYAADNYSQQHLIASVRIEDPTFGPDKRDTFRLPYLPEHNSAYSRGMLVGHGRLRVEPGRLGLVVQASQTDTSVRAMPVWDLAQLLFKAAGFRASMSNGGLITQQLVNQVGGYDGGRVFKIPGVRRLLRKHTATDSFTKQAALKLIGERDPDTGASFSDHHQLFIEPRDVASDLTSDMVFSYLVAKGVIRLGWDLSCPRCQLKDWTAINQLRQQHTCGYCGEGFDATRQLVETPMMFRRSGLLGIQKDAQGAIPVALVLQQLANNLSGLTNDAVLMPSIELFDDRPGGSGCETDLFALFPHGYPERPAVLIGECKDRDGQIDADDAAKLGALSARLEASGLDVYILFAKLGPFSEAEIALAKAINDPWQHRMILLTNRELEPYHLYERHSDEQGGQLYGGRLQDLALNSEQIYPGLRADPPEP